jgi:hypothetical protein
MFTKYLSLPASTQPGILLNAVEQYIRKQYISSSPACLDILLTQANRHADKAWKNKERCRHDCM